jgi:hypothetical protein
VIDLSVVVVTWNTRELTNGCLDALAAALDGDSRALAAEVICVDNGSTDGTGAALRARHPGVRLIALSKNVGFAAGANAGLRAARGRNILLLNSDARITRDALLRCTAYLREHPDVGVVGPQLENDDGSPQTSVHNMPTLFAELVPPGLLRILFRRRFPSWRSVGSEPVEVEAVRGAALFARRAVLREVGLLPEDYFFFLEETDWCGRVRRAGWRIVHLPGVRVTHTAGASSKRRHPALTRIEYHRSLYRFFRIHRGPRVAAMVFGLRLSKGIFYVAGRAPLALTGRRGRERWRVSCDVLAWHLRGCPPGTSLAAAGEPGARP